jgi:hypothetical protein
MFNGKSRKWVLLRDEVMCVGDREGTSRLGVGRPIATGDSAIRQFPLRIRMQFGNMHVSSRLPEPIGLLGATIAC